MANKIKIAMIGGGEGSMMGPVHRAAIRMTDKFELVAGIFSSDHNKSVNFAESLGIAAENVYEDYSQLAADSKKLGLDAVAIITPNNSHVPIAQAFVDQQVHVICEKPLSSDTNGVDHLAKSVEDNHVVFALTHTYSGYPIIRKARDLIAEGKIGDVKMVNVEYLQGWLSTLMEQNSEAKGAVWREDPKKGGAGGVLGDIGTHAFQLLEFVSGLQVQSLLADVSSIPGRNVPDDAKLLLKLQNGVTGSLWCSQVAVGCMNGLRFRIFGDKGSIAWSHERIEELHFYDSDNAETVYHKDNYGSIPPGHPEGYYEGFAQLYTEFADKIANSETVQPSSTLPGIHDGKRGLQFINASIESSKQGNKWISLST